jgi:hypothetical protein
MTEVGRLQGEFESTLRRQPVSYSIFEYRRPYRLGALSGAWNLPYIFNEGTK